MLLIVGLGNPGERYASNRHNVGYRIADAIHRRHGFQPWRRRFQGELSEGSLAGEKVLLLKPTTYMNESGRSVGEAARFYKLAAADVLVIHDELDLPPGKTRLKSGGGAGGNGGIKSIIAHLGEDFNRLRVGIGHPGRKELVNAYVLHDFAKEDGAWLQPLIEAIVDSAPLLAERKEQTFANRVHLATAPEKQRAGGSEPDERPAAGKAAEGRPDAPAGGRPGPLARGLSRLFGRQA
jgi:PTH1 family peptidyl-tRNA hydrolase